MVSAIKKREAPSISSMQIHNWKPPPNKSRLNLKKAREREQDKERALALTIDKAKREQEFDCLNKMGEACTMGKRHGISFSAYKGSDGSLKIHMIRERPGDIPMIENDENQDHQEKVEITIEEFMREYKSLKREQSSIKNAYLSGDTNSWGVSQNTIVSSYSLNRINKKKRQEELKQVLLDTMKLTTKLKE